MTSAGDVLYLPIPNPVRVPVPVFNSNRQSSQEQEQVRQHRIYRLPRNNPPQFAYSSNGYRIPQQSTGKIIDIYA